MSGRSDARAELIRQERKIPLIQHTPWKGHLYEEGIESQRVCIVGHSHWLDEGKEDSDDFTIDVVQGVIDGSCRISFFTQIKNYFDFSDHKEFWARVIFLNYLPECIGGPKERYNIETSDQVKRAKERFEDLIQKESPHKVFVFSKQAWSTFPLSRKKEVTDKGSRALDSREFPGFSWRTYDAGDHDAMAFGLRHTQGADGKLMRRAVRHILDIPVPGILSRTYELSLH